MAKKLTNNTDTENVIDILEQAKNVNQQTHNFIDWNQKTGNMLSDKSFDDTEVLENDWSDFGHSRHDVTSFNPNYKSGDLNEMRAADQGFWEKVGLGATKMTTTAASTFLNNTVGFLWGIGETFKTGNLSTIYDNSFTNLMQDWNDWCEKEMPHYSSKYEGWGADFWGNFIGKDILQNAGFQIGTGASLLVPGAFLKVGGNALKATKMLSNFMKTGRAINTGSAAKDLIIGTYAAIGESTVEALGNKRDFVKFQNQVADDEYARQKQQLDYEWSQLVQQKYGGNEELARNSMDFNEYFYKGQDLTRQRNERKKFIDKEAEKVADMTFLANLALVGGENFVTFGKAFGGYNLNKRFGNIANDIIDSEGKVLKKNVWDSTAEDIIRSGKYKVKNENYGKLIKNEEGKWIRDERKYLEKDAKIQARAKQSSTAFNFAKVAAGEGFEEMNQEVASQYSAGIAEQDMLAYEALAKDGMAYDEILQNLNSTWFSYGEFTKALGKVYSDPQQWRQFFGGMIGVGFSPHFTKGADGKLHFHINNLGAQNADINAKNQTNAYIAEQINNILNSPESQNYLQGMLRHKALDNVKADAVTRSSKMDYEDADFAQFVSDITMMSNAGKLGLLTASLDNMRNMNDDALKETCMQLAAQDKNGDTIGDFVDNNGNFLGNTDEEKLKIREKINKRIDKLQKDITLYQKAMNDIDGRTGGVLDHETLAAYTWEQCNVMNKYARSKDIIGREDSQKLLGVYSDRIGRSLLNYENSLKTTEDLLKGEKARIAEQPLAEGEKPKPSELQKKYESDIENLTKKINQAKELSQLLVDMKNLSVNNSDYKTDKDAIRTLFDKYSDFAKSMPFMAKQIGVLDENGNKKKVKDKNGKESDAGMSLEYLLFSKQFDLFISKYEDSQAAEIDAETKKVLKDLRDSAINYRKAILTEESLENLYEHPEEYVQQRAIFQQKVLEHTNKEAIKEITKEIKKRLNEGSIDAKNLDEKVKEIVEGIRKSKKEKRGFFKSLLNSVENTPYEQLISTAVREVLSDKKYENIKQMRDLIAYMNAAIMGNSVASSSAKRIALETFNKVLQNAKSVDDILKAEVKLENFDITPLYVEETDKNKAAKWNAVKQNPNGLPYDRSNYQYTVESVTNAKIIQNEALQLFDNSRELAKQMIWSPKLRSLNETAAKNSAEFETQSKRSQREKIEKNKSTIEEDINKILDTFEHSKQLNTSEQNELIKKVEKLVNDKFNTENFDDEFKDEVERLRSEYYRKAMDMVDNNLKKRIREYYKQSDDDIETRNQIDKAFGAINKAIGKIQRQLVKNDGNEVFADAFDSIATDDGSIELAHSTEGFYYYNGQVYRGNMIRCNYVNDKYNAVALEQLSDGRYNYLIIDNHGAVLANVITDDLREPEKRKAEIELTDAEVKSMKPDAFSLQRFANIGVLSEPNVESDKEQRSLQKRRQECCKALIDNGVLDKDGNVNIKSENLLPAIIQSSMIMNPKLTEDKTDIETVIESTKPKKDNSRKYRVFFDTNKGEWICAVLINKDIHFKDESGKTWVKRAKKELKNKTFDEVLRDMYGQDTEFFGITEEEWQMQYDKEYEREAQKELDKEEKEKQAIRELFDIDSIDTRKVDIEVVDKQWKSDPTKSNKTLRIYIKGQHQKGYFELVKDHEDGYYSVHFKTATDNANTNAYNNENAEVSTKYERSILFDQLANAIPVGAKVSTWGSLSPAGVKAIDKLGKMIGGKVVEHREVTSKVDGSKIQLPIYEKQDKNKSNVVVKSTSQPKVEQQTTVTPKQQKAIKRKVEQVKRKRIIKHLDEQITELEQMSENLRERAKENPSYYETLNTVETFKQYVQLIKEIQQNENVANPKNVVLDAKTVDSIVLKLQRQMKEIFGDGVQFMSDEEIGKNLSDNAQLSANLHNNSENLTFNNIDKAIETGEWNQEALDELNNLINDIENGTKHFKRFRPEISTSGGENSRTATKVSVVLRGSTDTSSTTQWLTLSERRKRDQAASPKQERIIENWAKAEGVWFDNLAEAVEGQDLLANHTSEAVVYRSKDGTKVTKVLSLSHFNNPQLAIDRIILHNHFFPNTPMKIVGFGYDKDEEFGTDEMNNNNKFRIVIEQPFVKGIKPTLEQINSVITKLSSEKLEQQKKPTTYKNSNYIVSDLHEGNVYHLTDENKQPLYDSDGNPLLAFIDTDWRLNTPDQGKDGNYVIDNSITSAQSEPIQFHIGKKARTEFENKLRKARPDMSDSEIKATLDFLHELADEKENNAYIKAAVTWVANKSISLPQDYEKTRQIFDVARKKNIDIQKYKTFGELMSAPEMQKKEKEKKAFNPDEAKTFSNKRTVRVSSRREFVVYDVEDTEEGQQDVVNAVAAHYESSPWCLATFTNTGKPTESAKTYWNKYNGIPRKIAFENGRPVAFCSDEPKRTLNGKKVVNYSQNSFAIVEEDVVFTDEELKELKKNGYLTGRSNEFGFDRFFELTEKGANEIVVEQSSRESWWDLNDVYPQEKLGTWVATERTRKDDPDGFVQEDNFTETLLDDLENFEREAREEQEDLDLNHFDIDDLPFSKSNGEIYGYATNGGIVINKDKFRLDTPVHEYTHLWDTALIEAANKGNEGAKALWQQGVELMKQTSEWDKVVNDPNYANIKDDENKVASEVHSRLSGMIAAGKMIEIAAKEQKKQTKKGLWARLIDWFKKFKDWTLGNIFNMSSDKAKEVTLDQFLNAPVADFFIGTDPRNIGKTDYSQPEQTKQDVVKNESQFVVGDTVTYGTYNDGKYNVVDKKAEVIGITDKGVKIKVGDTIKTVNEQFLSLLYHAKPSSILGNENNVLSIEKKLGEPVSYREALARYIADSDIAISENAAKDVTGVNKDFVSKDGKAFDTIADEFKGAYPQYANVDSQELENTISDLLKNNGSRLELEKYAAQLHFEQQDNDWQAEVNSIENSLNNEEYNNEILNPDELSDEEYAEMFKDEMLSDEELEKLYSDENDQIYEDYISQRTKELAESNIDNSEGYEDYLNREKLDEEEAQRKKLEGYQEPDDNAEMALIAETLAKLRGQIQDDGLDIINDNQALNVLSNVEKKKKEGVTLDTFKPAISEYSINDHSISFIDEAQKEGKDYKYIYDMYTSFDAFEYVKQGKLKPNQEVYIAFGHVGQYTVNGQLKRIWKPVFLVKDEKGEYQLIGTLSDSSEGDPDTAEKLSLTISNIYKNEKDRIEYRKIKATKTTDTFKAGEEKGFFLIKQKNGNYLTTKVSKVLNGSLLYSGEKQRSLKDVKIDKTEKTVNQSIDNGEQRPVRIGFYDGGTKLQDNMTADERAVSEIEGFRSKKSKQKGHVVLIINKPNGLYQLIPLHVSMFKDLMNNSYNPITKQIDEILKEAWKIYTSNESQKSKDSRLIEKGGIVSRLRNILHMSNMQVFFNLDDNFNQSIRINVNDKKEWAKSSPQNYDEFATFFKEQLADCFVNINSEILNNNAILNSYIQADVFKTNLESMEFRNAFFTVKPIDSDGNFLDSKKDMPESHDLKESDLSSDFKPFKVYKEGRMEYFVCKDLEGNFGVYSKKIGTKLYKKDNVNTDYRITTQMRMVEYALQKNGIKSGENKDYITTVTIEGSDNPIEVLAHPTVMETEYYNPETWEKVTDEVKTDKNKQKGETKQESVQKSEQSSEQKTNISDFANDNFTSKFVEFESGLDYTDGVSKLGQMLDSVNAQDISNYINGNHNLIDSSSLNKLKMLSKAFGEDMIKSFIDFKKQYNVTQTLNDLMEAIDFDDDDIEVDNEKVKEIFEKNKNKDLEKASNEVDNSCNIFDF